MPSWAPDMMKKKLIKGSRRAWKGVSSVTWAARKKVHEYLRLKKAVQGSSDLTAGYSINGRASDWLPPVYITARAPGYQD